MSRSLRGLLLIWAAALMLAKFADPAAALSVELLNITNDLLFSKADFEKVDPVIPHHTARQYLKIEYPEVINQEVRIFSNRTAPAPFVSTGAAAAFHPALLFPPPPAESGQELLPLFWLEASTPIPGGPRFSSGTETQWQRMIDMKDKDFERKKPLTRLALFPDRTSFVYLGVKASTSVPAGTYDTNLIVEVVTQARDVEPAQILAPACDKIPRTKLVRFATVVEDKFTVRQSTFFYRLKGESAFNAVSMRLNQRADNPFRWNAVALVESEKLQLGVYEYYYEATDGSFRSFFGSPESPRQLELISEFEEMSEPVSSEGGQFVNSVCALQAGAPDLVFPPGSLPANVVIRVKKMRSEVLPQVGGQSALTAYEFGPHGLHFDRPVPLTFSYVDDNQDGLVDGTGINESDLKIFWFDRFDWRPVAGVVDPIANKVTANIAHFSVYGVFPSGALTVSQVRPGEKIITPNGDGVNDFAQFGISGAFEIKILDIMGRLVRKLEGVSVWDGRKDDGGLAESGVYVYQVSSDQLSEKVTGTIGVAR